MLDKDMLERLFKITKSYFFRQILDDDLRGLIRLEESNYPEEDLKLEVKIIPKKVLSDEIRDSSRDQVAKALHHLQNCFSSIFEALVSLSYVLKTFFLNSVKIRKRVWTGQTF
jgi:hypothetical protein